MPMSILLFSAFDYGLSSSTTNISLMYQMLDEKKRRYREDTPLTRIHRWEA